MTKSRYIKPAAVKELEAMATASAKAKHPGNPYIIDRTFRDDQANDLTRCVVEYIRLRGGFASRISVQGTFNRRLNKYIPSTSRKGLPDVMAVFRGFPLHIEIKIGKDRQSEDQKKVEAEVTRSGGKYFICRDFESFYNWFNQLDNGSTYTGTD